MNRKYDNLFPTLSYANAFGPVQMQLSYSAKTHRPDFESLSSAVRYHSRYVYQSGNATLQPQTNHELGLNANWKWLTLITQYSRVDDAISQWSELYNDKGKVKDATESDTQRIKFSVRYNFNTTQSKYKGTGAGSDVKDRMK